MNGPFVTTLVKYPSLAFLKAVYARSFDVAGCTSARCITVRVPISDQACACLRTTTHVCT